MKRIVVQFLIFLTLLLLVSVVFFPYSKFLRRGIPLIERASAKFGIQTTIEDIALRFPPAIALKNVDIKIPIDGRIAPLFLDEVRIRPKILPLFLLRLAANVTVDAYGQKMFSAASLHLLSKTLHADFKVIDFPIENYPEIAWRGVSGGINADCKARVKLSSFTTKDIEEASLKFSITNGRYIGGHSLGGIITTPRIEDIFTDVSVLAVGNKILLENILFEASIGTIRGQGKVVLTPAGQLEYAEIPLSIELTASGRESIGGWLALRAGENVERDIRNWSVSVVYDRYGGKDIRVRARE